MLAPNSKEKGLRVDTCINCRRGIHEGDQAFWYADGPVACVKCAPTWAQALAAWEQEALENADGLIAFRKTYDAHIAAGGKPTDQCVSVL